MKLYVWRVHGRSYYPGTIAVAAQGLREARKAAFEQLAARDYTKAQRKEYAVGIARTALDFKRDVAGKPDEVLSLPAAVYQSGGD